MTARSTYRDRGLIPRVAVWPPVAQLGRALHAAVGVFGHQAFWDRLARRVAGALTRALLAAVLLAVAGMLVPLFAADRPFGIFTSLESPPTPEEVTVSIAAGVKNFEMDLDTSGAEDAVKAVKAAGGRVAAYHIGGGGGGAWERFEIAEFVRHYNTPEEFQALTEDTRRLVSLGADLIHFDNTHRMSDQHLESIAEAIFAGGAGFVAKNNPEKWRLVMKRRPELMAAYAVVEDAMFDGDTTRAAKETWGSTFSSSVSGGRWKRTPRPSPTTTPRNTRARIPGPTSS